MRRLASYDLLRALSLAVQRQPYRITFLSRAAHIPMCLKNYGLAVLGVPVRPFFCAMLSIELWNTFELCFLGHVDVHIDASIRHDCKHEHHHQPRLKSAALLTLACTRVRLAL